DAATGCQVWRTSLGTSFDVTRHKLQCNNIEPELGVTGTPAIDPQTGTVYVSPFLDPGRYELDALDLATGAIRWRHPIELPDSDAVVRLTPDRQRRDIYAPNNWKQLNRTDLDLGSVGPTLLDDGRLFQVGKEGVGYLLDAEHLGGVGGHLFTKAVSGGCYAIGA